MSRLFSFSHSKFHVLSPLCGSSRGIEGGFLGGGEVLSARGPTCTLGVLCATLCEPQRSGLVGPLGFHKTAHRAHTCMLTETPALRNRPQKPPIQREDPQEGPVEGRRRGRSAEGRQKSPAPKMLDEYVGAYVLLTALKHLSQHECVGNGSRATRTERQQRLKATVVGVTFLQQTHKKHKDLKKFLKMEKRKNKMKKKNG